MDPPASVVRTPDDRFVDLPGFAYRPRYAPIDDDRLGTMRMHYVDEGPSGADPVLLLHGQPTWCYLYRHVIEALAARGHRAVACDHIGFGRSDKPIDRTAHSLARHVRWLGALIDHLGLERITLVAQDWGGPIGLSALAVAPERFARVVATNTILHTADPALAGRLDWADHGIDGGRVVLQEALVDYVVGTQRMPRIVPSAFVDAATSSTLAKGVLAAYDAPFPDEAYAAGPRQLPILVPLTRNDPGAAIGRRTWSVLGGWTKPFLTAFSDGDPSTRGWAAVFQAKVPGAAGQPHTTIEGAGHFVQEDRGPQLAGVIAGFIEATR